MFLQRTWHELIILLNTLSPLLGINNIYIIICERKISSNLGYVKVKSVVGFYYLLYKEMNCTRKRFPSNLRISYIWIESCYIFKDNNLKNIAYDGSLNIPIKNILILKLVN